MGFAEGTLSFKEFAVKEPLPLWVVQEAVLEFLQGRDDAVVYGAYAVNAYVSHPRMTQDVDILSNRASELADELREHLHTRFQISVRKRTVKEGLGHRLYQVRKPKNRRLVDIRRIDELPPAQRVSRVLVMTPAALVASKVIAFHQRRGKPKSGTDWRDIAELLLTFPDLKSDPGPVTDRLTELGADNAILATWRELVSQEVQAEGDDEGY